MKSVFLRRSVFALTFIGVFTMVMTTLSAPAMAWTVAKNRRYSAEEKPLTKRHAKSMAQKVVDQMLERLFFKEDELARRFALSLIPVWVNNKEFNEREFTDMILNALLNRPQVAIVNQDPDFSLENLNFKLVFYENGWEVRRKGLLMGADYVISGDLQEGIVQDTKGRDRKSYEAKLEIRNIRTNELLLSEKFIQTHKTKKRRR